MNITIIGSGSFAQKHALILSEMDDVTVTAFCSRRAERAEAAASNLAAKTGRAVNSYTDLPVALDQEMPDAAVIVVTPDAHGEIEIELVKRGIPFLVEKPIGMDPQTPRWIAEEVAKEDLVTSVGFHMRYLDTAGALRTMLQATTPALANGYWMGTLPPPAWWRHIDESGGQFVEQTVHMIDLLRYLLGEVASVGAMTSSRAIAELHADADIPDAGAAVLRMRSGMTAMLVNSCVGPVGVRTGMEVVSPAAQFQFEPAALTVRTRYETTETRPRIDPYRAEDSAFVYAVRTGDRSRILSPYADALKSHAVSMAIVESARTGRTVEL